MGEGKTKPEIVYAAAYAACAGIAFVASRARGNPATSETAPFWLRIAFVCAAFAVLRAVDAQMAVSDAFGEYYHSAGLSDWSRPGPYILIVVFLALAFAGAGLFLFRLRTLHRSVLWAAASIAALVVLALSHSLALYYPNMILQTQVGPATVSRIIEAILLATLAWSAWWFIRDAKARGAVAQEA
ncbi:hypothetical protein [Sphingomonas daechungensis]